MDDSVNRWSDVGRESGIGEMQRRDSRMEMGERIGFGTDGTISAFGQGGAYLEFLRKDALSAGIYVLGVGSQDSQKPHAEDEIYYVMAGRAHFTSGEQDGPIRAGDLLYVPAGEPHRFHSIEEELRLLVFFAPAETNS